MYVEDVEMLTIEEDWEVVGIRHKAMYRLLISRKLKGYRNGRYWRILRAALC